MAADNFFANASELVNVVTGYYKRERLAAGRAVSGVILRRTDKLKNTLRRQVVSAGLGTKLSKAWRSTVYPTRGVSARAAGIVFSKALTSRKPRGKSRSILIDLFDVFDQTTTITAPSGKVLAIPVGRAKRSRPAQRRPKPSDWPAGTFEFVPDKDGGNVIGLLAFKGRRTKRKRRVFKKNVAFILVKQVGLKKRLSIDPAWRAAIAGLEHELVAEWEREAAREGVKAA